MEERMSSELVISSTVDNPLAQGTWLEQTKGTDILTASAAVMQNVSENDTLIAKSIRFITVRKSRCSSQRTPISR